MRSKAARNLLHTPCAGTFRQIPARSGTARRPPHTSRAFGDGVNQDQTLNQGGQGKADLNVDGYADRLYDCEFRSDLAQCPRPSPPPSLRPTHCDSRAAIHALRPTRYTSLPAIIHPLNIYSPPTPSTFHAPRSTSCTSTHSMFTRHALPPLTFHVMFHATFHVTFHVRTVGEYLLRKVRFAENPNATMDDVNCR